MVSSAAPDTVSAASEESAESRDEFQKRQKFARWHFSNIPGLQHWESRAIAQERNAKKHAGKDKKSELGMGAKALKAQCEVCKQQVINYTQLVQHYESKHPKLPVPPAPE